MKKYQKILKMLILTLTLLIGTNLTVWSQSYVTGKVDFGEEQMQCWDYNTASHIVNAGIKGLEWEAKYLNMSNIVDSLNLQIDIIDSKYKISKHNFALCNEKNADLQIIMLHKDNLINALNKELRVKDTIMISGGIGFVLTILALLII